MPNCLCESWLSRYGHLAGEGRRERFEDEPWQAAVLGKVGEGGLGERCGHFGGGARSGGALWGRPVAEGAPEEVDARVGQFPI